MHEPRASDAVSKKAAVGVLLFVFCSLLSSIRIILAAPTPAHLHADEISQRSDQRFAFVKRRLPAKGVIGYIGESGNSGTADYYLAQYALAPLVLDRSPRHKVVIGNFPSAAPSSLPPDLQLNENLGAGVLLFAGEDSR